MATNSLGPRSNLYRASSDAIQTHLRSFAGKRTDLWLDPDHPAKSGQFIASATNAKIRRLDRARQSLTDTQMAEITAACGPCHCFDGWSFLARSASALISGDPHSAKHFAYYGQLRAAMSMLAFSGIGIFDCLNIVVDKNGAIHKLEDDRDTVKGQPTHRIVWSALEEWAQIDQNAEGLLSSIHLGGETCLEAIREIWPGRQVAPVVATLINAWSFDYGLGEWHREQRNISSYLPHALNPTGANFENNVSFICSFWRLLEPAGLGYQKIDACFLRRVLGMIHDFDTREMDKEDQSNLETSSISSKYASLGDGLRGIVSKEFLLSKDHNDIFEFAAKQDNSPISMISRAFVLLRAASALYANIVGGPRGSATLALKPWLIGTLHERGIVPSGDADFSVSDMWDGASCAVQDCLEALESCRGSAYHFHEMEANGVPIVTQFERAAVWGIIN